MPVPFYDADAIAQTLGDYNDPVAQGAARAMVDAGAARGIERGESFGFESTYAGRSRPAIVAAAHAAGYRAEVVFFDRRLEFADFFPGHLLANRLDADTEERAGERNGRAGVRYTSCNYPLEKVAPMSRKESVERWRTAYRPLVRSRISAKPGDMATSKDEAPVDVVTDADRAYLARVAEGNAAARADDRPAGSLAVALERMGMIEHAMGIDALATALEHWTDRESHMSFLAAVKKKKAVAGTSVGVERSP